MASALKQKIEADLKQALKDRAAEKLVTLRMLSAALHNREIEKRSKGGNPASAGELSDEEVLEVVGREAKKRKEAAEFFMKGDRKELAEKENSELKLLEIYLPAQMSEAEVRKIVEGVVSRMQGEKNFGKLMGETMKELKGKADAKLVGEILKEKLTHLK
ncbi:MAG: GatB/YqeY domain-containing protein [Patescibacteria group bacterium]